MIKELGTKWKLIYPVTQKLNLAMVFVLNVTKNKWKIWSKSSNISTHEEGKGCVHITSTT
jgi:hypothetical protein